MRKGIAAGLLVLCVYGQTAHRKTETFWEKLLRIAGVSATPGSLRGDEKSAGGDVWLATVAPKPVLKRVTSGGGFRSPVFHGAGRAVLALKGTDLDRIPTSGEPPARLYTIAGVSKLVGVDRQNPDQLLVVLKDAQDHPAAALVSVQTGKVTVIPHDPQSSEDQVLLGHLLGWERIYGSTRLYMANSEKEAAAGTTIEFSDIYLKRGGDPPINITNGDGISSSQPSLSADERQIIFIRRAR